MNNLSINQLNHSISGQEPSTVDTMSKNAGENRHSDSVNTVNSEKAHLFHPAALQLFASNSKEVAHYQNTSFALEPTIITTRNAADFFQFDHTTIKFTDGHSSGANFEYATAIPLDIDNSHSDNACDWIHPDDFEKVLQELGLNYGMTASRNHWGIKDGKAARPKFHVYLPLAAPLYDKEKFVRYCEWCIKTFNSDPQVKSRAQKIFGYGDNPKHFFRDWKDGRCIDEILSDADLDIVATPAPAVSMHEVTTSISRPPYEGENFFDWFVNSGEWIKHLPDLEARGWKFTHEKEGQLFFQTPDGERGNGKHDGNIKNGVAYFFSRAPFPFGLNKGYSICRLFAGVLFGDTNKKGLAKFAERYFSNRCEECSSPAEDLDTNDLRYAPFPIECFSKVMQNITRGVQRTIGLKDSSAPATSCLAVFSAVIGASCKIRIKPGYEQPAHIFSGIVRKSGRAKSPVMEYFLEVFEQKQSEWVDEWNAANDAYKQKMTAWNAKPKDRRGDCPDEPAPAKRLVVTDFTIEALARRLNENPLGLFAYADELEALFGNMGRYNSGKDMPHYISIHNGKPLTIDRVKDGLIYIPRPSLSICGAIQPSILRKRLGENPDYFHSGFIARFLLSMPPDEPIKLNRHRLTDTERSGYEKFITSILSVREKTLVEGKVKPIVFDISSEAFDLLVEYQHKHADLAVYETENNSGAEGKFMTNAARIALILHVADLYDSGKSISASIPISATTMRNACIIAEWFVNEAKRIYASLVGGQVEGELTADQREVMKVLRRINKPATPREMKRPSRVLQRMDNLDEVLQELVRLGLIQEQFRDDGYHKNGVLEYRITPVATVDADTMLINSGENRHAINAYAVSSEIMAMPSTCVIEGFEEYRVSEPAVVEVTSEAIIIEQEEAEPEKPAEKDLTALANMIHTSQQPITFSTVLSHFDDDRVPACQFLRDNGFEISDTDTGEQVIIVPEKALPSATGRQKPASYTSPGSKYEKQTSPEGLPVRINNWQGIKGKRWD